MIFAIVISILALNTFMIVTYTCNKQNNLPPLRNILVSWGNLPINGRNRTFSGPTLTKMDNGCLDGELIGDNVRLALDNGILTP